MEVHRALATGQSADDALHIVHLRVGECFSKYSSALFSPGPSVHDVLHSPHLLFLGFSFLIGRAKRRKQHHLMFQQVFFQASDAEEMFGTTKLKPAAAAIARSPSAKMRL